MIAAYQPSRIHCNNNLSRLKLWLQIVVLAFFGLHLSGPSLLAQGGTVTQPYWTFETEARVTIIRAADIDGDGEREVVLGTADNWLYLLQNDGHLLWSDETGSSVSDLLVADLDTDGLVELIVGLDDGGVSLFRPNHGLVWSYAIEGKVNALTLVDLDGDGRKEVLVAAQNGEVLALNSHGHLLWSYDLGHPIVQVVAADVDGDGRPEVIPTPSRDDEVWVFEADGQLAWRRQATGDVGVVGSGDVNGNGRSEIVVFGTAREITLLSGNGQELWRDDSVALTFAHDEPEADHLYLSDLDGDGRQEIVTIGTSPAAVYVLQGDGRPLWRHIFGAVSYQTSKVFVRHVNHSFVLVVPSVQEPIRLLDDHGVTIAEYRTAGASGALDYADLNGDGWGELMAGTINGLQVFGTSAETTIAPVWNRRVGSPPVALEFGDVDGDGTGDVVAGTQDGRVLATSYDNEPLWDIGVQAAVVALALGDVDGDGHDEAVAGTWSDLSGSGGQLQLIAAGKRKWSVPAGAYIIDLAVRDLTGNDQAEIIAAFGLETGGSAVAVLTDQGQARWQENLSEQITAVGSHGSAVLVGTASGRVLRFTVDGTPRQQLELGHAIRSVDGSLAVTTDGQVYQLPPASSDLATVIYASAQPPDRVAINETALLLGCGGDQLSHVSLPAQAAGEAGPLAAIAWQTTLETQITSLALGDLNSDGLTEFAVGTQRGRMILFAPTLNQPPLLTDPAFLEVGTGYSYAINVYDPDREQVRVTLEIWDPSQQTWRVDHELVLEKGAGLLNWSVPNAFDTWDSGRDSRFRFLYDDGHTQASTGETPGPFAITTTPWYIYYGVRIGLVVLFLALPALGLLFFYRQRVYRRSPPGQAETLLKYLQANPATALLTLRKLARSEPTHLTLLTGLAREVNEIEIARLSEGYQLIVTQPSLAAQGLETVLEAGTQLPSEAEAKALLGRYGVLLRAMEANTLSRIVALHSMLVGESDVELVQVIHPLANFQRVETLTDKVAYLGQAMEMLGRLERESIATLPQPEQNILRQVASGWLQVTNNALQDLQGRARLEMALKTRHLLRLEQATLSLELTNSGRSPASNITISLAPDQDNAAGNGRVELELLPAGHSVMVELPVSGVEAVDQFRVEFLITYDDRERAGKSLAFADIVHLLRPAAEFRPIPNPYAPGTPLSPNSPIFFGRDDLFQFITENLAGLTRQNILVLIGQRRMGKTSFLQQLPARLGHTYIPVYIDGQSLGIDPGMDNFFYDLALAVVDALVDQEIELEEPEPAAFAERPSGVFERVFLPRVFERVGQRKLLLLFDEFEELEMRVASGKLEATIFPYFRHLMQHHRRLGFIFVGTHKLESLSSDYWSIFFNIAMYKHVAFLDETAAKALITEPVAEYGLIYDDLALEKMVRATAGHPYFLQLTCHALVNRANREAQNYLTIQDVNTVLEEMVELGEAHFAFLWEQADPTEQVVLAALTRVLGQGPSATSTQVAETLVERAVQVTAREVSEALRRLAERDVIREITDQPPRYEYKVELVRLWVERYKTLGRVIELNWS
jgi:hypothetical protein